MPFNFTLPLRNRQGVEDMIRCPLKGLVCLPDITCSQHKWGEKYELSTCTGYFVYPF